jgi:hypothetical protein
MAVQHDQRGMVRFSMVSAEAGMGLKVGVKSGLSCDEENRQRRLFTNTGQEHLHGWVNKTDCACYPSISAIEHLVDAAQRYV